jgi:hypothetical protein
MRDVHKTFKKGPTSILKICYIMKATDRNMQYFENSFLIQKVYKRQADRQVFLL